MKNNTIRDRILENASSPMKASAMIATLFLLQMLLVAPVALVISGFHHWEFTGWGMLPRVILGIWAFVILMIGIASIRNEQAKRRKK